MIPIRFSVSRAVTRPTSVGRMIHCDAACRAGCVSLWESPRVSAAGSATVEPRMVRHRGMPGCINERECMTLLAEYYVPGLHIEDRSATVPLDWAGHEPGRGFDGESISLFYRVVTAPEHVHDDLPLLVFLQGGPGGAGPRLLEPVERRMDCGGGQAFPCGAAGSARHGPLFARRLACHGEARRRGSACASGLPQAVPRGFDRAGLRTSAPHRVRRLAVGDAWPELWRIPDADLPVAVPRRSGRELHLRRHPACPGERDRGL